MAFKLIQIRTFNGNSDNDRAVRDIVDGSNEASFLPAPLIFPPMYMIKGTEDIATKLREKLGDDANVEVLQDMED
ncbi:hypothetical protein ACHAPT_010894 [Fusarium lateritium]